MSDTQNQTGGSGRTMGGSMGSEASDFGAAEPTGQANTLDDIDPGKDHGSLGLPGEERGANREPIEGDPEGEHGLHVHN